MKILLLDIETAHLHHCRLCGEDKPRTEFYRKNATVCKPCANKESRDWQRSNPDLVKRIRRNTKLKQKYGLTESAYNQLLAAQGYGCAICGGTSDRRPLDVDHCHSSGKIRGILCENCNRALGLMKDRIELLEKAIAYLEAAR